MTSNPRGLAVIINNRCFVDMSPRDGTGCDFDMLTSLFIKLKFELETFRGLSAEVGVLSVKHF